MNCQSRSLALLRGMKRSSVRRTTPVVRRIDPRSHTRPFCFGENAMYDRETFRKLNKIASRKYQATHKEIIRDRRKKKRAEKHEMILRQERIRHANNPRDPIKQKAQGILIHAVEKHKIFKPSECQICGKSTPRNILHGHHSDYTKPLDVMWLCPVCHGQFHKKIV
jgi:hypothetical protein